MQSVYVPRQRYQPQSLLQLFETISSDQQISSAVREEFILNSEIYTQLVNRDGIPFVTLSALPLQFLIELRQNSSMYIRFHRAGVSLEALSRLALELREELQQKGYILLLEEGVIDLEKILDLEPEIRTELAQNSDTYIGICVEYGYPLFENLLALKLPILKELRQILSAPRIINKNSNTVKELPDNYQLEAQNVADLAALIIHIANGDNVTDIVEVGSMSLLIAANHNALQIMELLIAHGADVNCRQIGSITPTPLHIAVKQCNGRFARSLVNFGADLKLTNNLGQTPIEYARNNNQLLLANALETDSDEAWKAAIADELQHERQRNLIIFSMELQHKNNPDYPYMRFFDRHELNHNIARAIYTGEITNEEELKRMYKRKKKPVEYKSESPPQEYNIDAFTLNRAIAIVKTAALILGVEEKEEQLKKAASFIKNNNNSFNLHTAFRSFCTKEEVTKILSCYKQLPAQEAIAKIYYFRNYPPLEFTLESLVEILRSPDCKLNVVEFSENNLSATETQLLSQGLKDNQTVTHLEVDRTGMDAEGMAYLAEILPNCKIVYLNVGDNRLCALGARYLANILPKSSIEHLKIYSNNIGIKGIKDISKALTKKCLKSLNLFDNNLSDEGIKHLAAALKELGKGNQLNDLSIGNNQISSDGALCICKSYSKMNQPLKIDFSYNNFRKDWFFIAHQLPPSLVLLNFKKIGIKSEEFLFLIKALQKLKNLHILDIADNSIDDEVLATLISELPFTITSLSLEKTGIAEKGIAALASLMLKAKINHLNLAHNSFGDKAILALIENNQASSDLEVFTISNNTITDKVIPQLQHWLEPCKTHVFFQFENNSFTKTGESKLSENDALDTIEWNINEQELDDEKVKQLAEMLRLNQHIISLHLCKNKIEASAIRILADAMPLTNISTLTLSQNDMDSETIAPLLQQLSNTKIRYLNLSHNKLNDDTVRLICYALMQSGSQLQAIYLGNNSLTEKSGQYLAHAIPRSKLQHLDLHHNQLGASGAKYIGDILSQSSLAYLDLSENKLSNKGIKNISVNLEGCHHLQRLYLNDNDINDEGIQNFSRGLLGNESLTDIQLSKNKIGDEGIITLMKVLPTTNIIKVYLSGNIYSKKIFNNISEAICQHKFKEKNLLIVDDHYSVLINNEKRNINHRHFYMGITVSSQPLLIFLAAPSCSGKGVFWDLLKNEGLVDDSMRIETKCYSELVGYNEHKAKGIRHPELEPDLYELHNKKRITLLTERFKNRQIAFVEVHLNDNEARQISFLAEMAKKNGYWTAIIGLSVQPDKLFQNARKASKEAVISSREILTELKDFCRLFNQLTSFDYKFSTDFNVAISKKEKPFLISLKVPDQEELVFNEAAWKSAQTNASLDIEKLVTQFDTRKDSGVEKKRDEIEMNLPSPLKILSELSHNKPDFLNNLFCYLIPDRKLLECIDDFKQVQLLDDYSVLSPNLPMIFVVRHAESEANVLEKKGETVTTSDQNIGLTENGYLQAIILAECMSYISKIRKRKVNVYYSPAHRTVETMNIMLSKIGNYQGTITREECLRERSAGLFHGLSSEGRAELYPTQSSFFEYQKKLNKSEATMPGGESIFDVKLRLKKFVTYCHNYLDDKPDEDIIIVTHAKTSMVLRKMLCYDSQVEKWYNEQDSEPSNASVFVIAEMPKPIKLADRDLEKIYRQFFDGDIHNKVINNSFQFILSCLGYLNQSIQDAAGKSQVAIESKSKEVLQNFLRINCQDVKSKSDERPYSLLLNMLFSGLRYIEETRNNRFHRKTELVTQDLELFNSQLFKMVQKDKISNLSQSDVLRKILSLSIFHQRKTSDYENLILFSNYFSSELEGETKEVRNHAQIARKGLDMEKKEYSIEDQFSHADDWLNFMLCKNRGDLFTKIKQALIASNLKKNDTITIVYPIGEKGSSKNIISIVYSEILKKKLSILIDEDENFYMNQISIITRPIIQKTMTKRSNLNPFEKAIYRSYYNVPITQGKILLVDDDVTTGSSMSEMISACRLNGNHIIGYVVAAIIPGCEVLRIHPAVKEALEQALREGYQVKNPHFGPDDPVEIYNSILKGVGLCDGIDSLTNMMGIFQVAALYEPAKAEQIVEYIWNISTQEISGQSYQDICNLFKRDVKLFPILAEIQKERLSINTILEDLSRVTNPLKQIREGWDKQMDCPRKFMLKFPIEKDREGLDAKDVKTDFLPSKKIEPFDLGYSNSVFSLPFLLSERQQEKTGPRFIKGWQLQDVEDKGNCFYLAIIEQMKIINHSFLEAVPVGTSSQDSLRLRIQSRNFNDGEWADAQEIFEVVRQFRAVVAVIDTRRPDLGFHCYYLNTQGEVNDTHNADEIPTDRPIFKLAFTGNHYLSAQAHPSLDIGAIRRGFIDPWLSYISSSTSSSFWSRQMTRLYEKHHNKSSHAIS